MRIRCGRLDTCLDSWAYLCLFHYITLFNVQSPDMIQSPDMSSYHMVWLIQIIFIPCVHVTLASRVLLTASKACKSTMHEVLILWQQIKELHAANQY